MMKGVMQCAQEGLTGYDDGSKSKVLNRFNIQQNKMNKQV